MVSPHSVCMGCEEILVLHRKSKDDVKATDYVGREQCYAYVLKRELWRHKCAFGNAHKSPVAFSVHLLLPSPCTVTPEVHELVSSMIENDIQFLAKCDDLITEYRM